MSAAEKLPAPDDPNVGRAMGFEEYMDLCEVTGRRYERTRGIVTRPPEGMAGASPEHNKAKGDLYTDLNNAFRDSGSTCTAIDSDDAVRIDAFQKDVFPDAGAYCGKPDYHEEGRKKSLRNPVLIVEVLSPTTRRYDITEKLRMYQSLESLREYVLVETELIDVKLLRRTESGWSIQTYSSLEDVVELESVGVSLPVASVYRRIEIVPEADADGFEGS